MRPPDVGLAQAYDKIIAYLQNDCKLLLEACRAPGVRECDFVVNAVWPEVSSCAHVIIELFLEYLPCLSRLPTLCRRGAHLFSTQDCRISSKRWILPSFRSHVLVMGVGRIIGPACSLSSSLRPRADLLKVLLLCAIMPRSLHFASAGRCPCTFNSGHRFRIDHNGSYAH